MPINIHGKQYVPVAERLREFHARYENSAIKTVIEYPDQETVRASATVWPDVNNQLRFFTGHSEENRKFGINQKSATENAETSAIGRALAAMGISIEGGIASAEEMNKAITEEPATVFTLPEEPTTMKQKTCTKCGKTHNGKYAKCIECWKADKEQK